MASKIKYDEVGSLATEIVLDVMPHDDTKPGYGEEGWYVWRPRPEAAAKNVSAADLEVGDVIALRDVDSRQGYHHSSVGRDTTVRDFVAMSGGWRQGRTRLGLIVGKTAKQVRYVPLDWGWWNYDLATLGRDPKTDEWMTQRIAGAGTKQDVIRLGRYEDILEAIKAHPKFGEWKALHDTVCAQHARVEAKDAAKVRKDNEIKREKVARLKPQADAINAAFGVKVLGLDVDWRGSSVRFMREKDVTGLSLSRYVIAGRLALGEITQQQHDAALEALQEHFTKSVKPVDPSADLTIDVERWLEDD